MSEHSDARADVLVVLFDSALCSLVALHSVTWHRLVGSFPCILVLLYHRVLSSCCQARHEAADARLRCGWQAAAAAFCTASIAILSGLAVMTVILVQVCLHSAANMRRFHEASYRA